MKTIKKGETIKRVSDSEAIFFTKNGWDYCPKTEWKKDRKVKTNIPQEEVSDNISDKKKRKMRKENKRKKYQNN